MNNEKFNLTIRFYVPYSNKLKRIRKIPFSKVD